MAIDVWYKNQHMHCNNIHILPPAMSLSFILNLVGHINLTKILKLLKKFNYKTHENVLVEIPVCVYVFLMVKYFSRETIKKG